MERSKKKLDECNKKVEIQEQHNISIRLSEIPTIDLHKYFYPFYFLFIY